MEPEGLEANLRPFVDSVAEYVRGRQERRYSLGRRTELPLPVIMALLENARGIPLGPRGLGNLLDVAYEAQQVTWLALLRPVLAVSTQRFLETFLNRVGLHARGLVGRSHSHPLESVPLIEDTLKGFLMDQALQLIRGFERRPPEQPVREVPPERIWEMLSMVYGTEAAAIRAAKMENPAITWEQFAVYNPVRVLNEEVIYKTMFDSYVQRDAISLDALPRAGIVAEDWMFDQAEVYAANPQTVQRSFQFPVYLAREQKLWGELAESFMETTIEKTDYTGPDMRLNLLKRFVRLGRLFPSFAPTFKLWMDGKTLDALAQALPRFVGFQAGSTRIRAPMVNFWGFVGPRPMDFIEVIGTMVPDPLVRDDVRRFLTVIRDKLKLDGGRVPDPHGPYRYLTNDWVGRRIEAQVMEMVDQYSKTLPLRGAMLRDPMLGPGQNSEPLGNRQRRIINNYLDQVVISDLEMPMVHSAFRELLQTVFGIPDDTMVLPPIEEQIRRRRRGGVGIPPLEIVFPLEEPPPRRGAPGQVLIRRRIPKTVQQEQAWRAMMLADLWDWRQGHRTIPVIGGFSNTDKQKGMLPTRVIVRNDQYMELPFDITRNPIRSEEGPVNEEEDQGEEVYQGPVSESGENLELFDPAPDLPTWFKYNLMLLTRECCFRIWKMSAILQALGKIPVSQAIITVRLEIQAWTVTKLRPLGWNSTNYVYYSTSWRIWSPILQRDEFLQSITNLVNRFWKEVPGLYEHATQEMYEQYGQGVQSRVKNMTVRSNYVVGFVETMESIIHGPSTQANRLRAKAYWFSANRMAAAGQQWRVMARFQQDWILPQYKDFLEQCRRSPEREVGITKLCLFRVVAYHIGFERIREEPIWGNICNGYVYKVIQNLAKMGFRLGLLRQSCLQFSTYQQGFNHLYLSPTHVTIVGPEKAKELMSQRTEAASASMSGSLYKPRGLFIVSNPQMIVSMKKSLFLKGDIPVFEQDQVTLSGVFRVDTMFWDIECLAVEEESQSCYLSVMVGWLDVYWRTYIHVATNPFQNVIANFVQTLLVIDQDLRIRKSKLRIWTYNGFKYEMKFLLVELTKAFGSIKSFGQLSGTKGVMITSRITLLDVRNLYPSGSLKTNAQEFNKYYLKQDFAVGCIKTWADVNLRLAEAMQYCHSDCMATFQLTQRWFLGVLVISQLKISLDNQGFVPVDQGFTKEREVLPISTILGLFTCPQLAMAFFCWHFLGSQTLKDNEPEEVKRLQREFYFGGMTEVFRHFGKERIWYLDVFSMYPWVMTLRLPWYYVKHHQINELDEELKAIRQGRRDLWFYHVLRMGVRGCHPSPKRTKKGLVYGQTVQNCWVWGRALRSTKILSLVCEEAHEYTDISPLTGTAVRASRQYVQFLYHQKKTCSKGDKSKKTLLKLLLNSLYGKWGQRRFGQHHYMSNENFDETEFDPEDYLKANRNDYFCHIETSSQSTNKVGDFVRLASFVTCGARSKLVDSILQAGPGNVFYCDTDSVFVNEAGYNNLLDLIDQTGDQVLGNFKVQSFDGGQGIFQEGVFVARKCYMLINKKGNYLFKAKGVNWRLGEKMGQEHLSRLYGMFWKKVPEACLFLQTEVKSMFPLGIEVMSNRWIWNSTKDAVVIEEYYKKINMNPKRRVKANGSTQPLKQEDMIKYI